MHELIPLHRNKCTKPCDLPPRNSGHLVKNYFRLAITSSATFRGTTPLESRKRLLTGQAVLFPRGDYLFGDIPRHDGIMAELKVWDGAAFRKGAELCRVAEEF